MLKIKVENLQKNFNMEIKNNQSVLEFLLSIFSINKKPNFKNLAIINNVSFEVFSGQILGIVGSNGSGKSTLLKIIANIYKQDSGMVKVIGQSVYLNGFGQGLMPKLTMRENIYLIGAIMGLSNKEIKNNFDKVVEFSGLKDFVDNRVYQFSSGMIVRLIFSTTIIFLEHKNPDIILLDEVFEAGGDIDFKDKAIKKMEEFVQNNKAVILVSHQMETVKKYCHKTLWLKNGKIASIGNTEEVVDEYVKETFK